MKNESAYTKKFVALLKKIKEAHQPAAFSEYDPVEHLVVAFLQWNSSRKLAEAAFTKLMAPMVDKNDLRVSHPHEIVALIGEDYPRADERAARLHESLQEIYNREHGVTLDSVSSQGKKQARTYLDSLPGMVSYVSSRVMLLSVNAHAIPVDDLLRDKLVSEEVVEPDATVEEISAFIERQVKSGEGIAAHLAMDEWSTVGGVRKTTSAPRKLPPAKPVPAKIEAAPAKAASTKTDAAKSESKTNKKTTAQTPAAAIKKPVAKTVKKTTKTTKKTTKKTAD